MLSIQGYEIHEVIHTSEQTVVYKGRTTQGQQPIIFKFLNSHSCNRAKHGGSRRHQRLMDEAGIFHGKSPRLPAQLSP